MLRNILLVLSTYWIQQALCDVSHISTTTEYYGPPRPYSFSYTAGRYPGHSDRQHTEVSDGNIVRGSFSYVDPRNKLRSVEYTADENGFHPLVNGGSEYPTDTEAVAKEKARHYNLYAKIAQQHSNPQEIQARPRQTAAWSAAARAHAALFAEIAEQHARIAAERELIQAEQQLEDAEQEH